jgi:hypothetical protein
MLEMVQKETDMANRHKMLLKTYGAINLHKKDKEATNKQWNEVHKKRYNNLERKEMIDHAEYQRKYFLLFK